MLECKEITSFLTATRLANSGLFDTRKHCPAASCASAWGLWIFLLRQRASGDITRLPACLYLNKNNKNSNKNDDDDDDDNNNNNNNKFNGFFQDYLGKPVPISWILLKHR